MPFFRKRPTSPIPGLSDADFAELLGRFGRERVLGEFGPATQTLGTIIYPTYQRATAAPDAFYDGLNRCADMSASPWAWVGAARMVSEVGVAGFDTDERYAVIVDRAFQFLRSRWIPTSFVTGYENDVWQRLHPDERWFEPLPGRPVEGSPVRDLAIGEEREIAVLLGGNRFRVSRLLTGQYVGYMDRVRSSDDSTLVRDEEPANAADSLPELYHRVAAGFGSPPSWVDPELEPYFIYAKPDFSA